MLLTFLLSLLKRLPSFPPLASKEELVLVLRENVLGVERDDWEEEGGDFWSCMDADAVSDFESGG